MFINASALPPRTANRMRTKEQRQQWDEKSKIKDTRSSWEKASCWPTPNEVIIVGRQGGLYPTEWELMAQSPNQVEIVWRIVRANGWLEGQNSPSQVELTDVHFLAFKALYSYPLYPSTVPIPFSFVISLDFD